MLSDTELIEKAIQYISSNSLATIFKDRNILKTVTIVSFDDHNLYVYKNIDSNIKLSKIPHKENVLDKTKQGWSAYLRQGEDFRKYFSKDYKIQNIISGGLCSDFSKLQRNLGTIYTNQESCIATIIHEYAHIYFNNKNPFYYSDREEIVNILDTSIKLYKNKETNLEQKFFIPSYKNFSELFAFCTEYEFSRKYAPTHFSIMNKKITRFLQEHLKKERKKNLKEEDSVLEDPHFFSWILGKILIEKYPSRWHKILFEKTFI